VTQQYDRVARGLHWLIAALAVIVVAFGWAIPEAPRGTPSRDVLLLLHRSLGLTILAAMLCRGLWRWHHPPPPLPLGLARIEVIGAHASHFVLYALLIALPLAGYVNAAAAGHRVSFFGLAAIPPLLPESGYASQVAIATHQLGQYLLYLFVALHIGGALLHRFVHRDGVIDRMLPVRRRFSRARP
jgi:cytochrome b561